MGNHVLLAYEQHQLSQVSYRAAEPGDHTQQRQRGGFRAGAAGRRTNNAPAAPSTIHDVAHAELGSFTLTEPLDAALVDDHRVSHG